MGSHDVTFWIARFSYLAVIVLCWACGLGAPLSEDLIILAGGALAARSGAALVPMMLSAGVGQLGGDLLLFGIGRRFGVRALTLPGIRHVLTPERAQRVRERFARSGTRWVFFARFLPGFRSPTFLMAGMSGLSPRRFLQADGLAALIAAPTMTWLGYRFGPSVLSLLQPGARWVALGAVTFVAAIWAVQRWRARHVAVQNAKRAAADSSEALSVAPLGEP